VNFLVNEEFECQEYAAHRENKLQKPAQIPSVKAPDPSQRGVDGLLVHLGGKVIPTEYLLIQNVKHVVLLLLLLCIFLLLASLLLREFFVLFFASFGPVVLKSI